MNLRSNLALLAALLTTAAAPPTAEREANKAALAPWQSYIGEWRGVGQPERGSQKGAWTEQASWAWHFGDDGATIEFAAPESKQLLSGTIGLGDRPGTFRLVAKSLDGVEHAFTGTVNDEGQWLFTANDADPAPIAQITLRQVADGARMIVLLEKRVSPTRLARVAEIGYTRKGAAFASGQTGPECIVTGGDGTIPVMYQGKTYYVCCTGCKQLFDEDPAAIIAEYQARQAKRGE